MAAGEQCQTVEPLPLNWVVHHQGALAPPFDVGIEVGAWRLHSRVLYGVHDRRIGQLRQAGVMVVERVAVDMRLAYDFGDGDLAVFVVCRQLPERVFDAFGRGSISESLRGRGMMVPFLRDVRLSFIGHYVYMCDMDYCRADCEADDRKIGELSIFLGWRNRVRARDGYREERDRTAAMSSPIASIR